VDRRQLGSTGIEVPAIGMGTWRTFDTDEDRSWLVDEALAAGINLFDSSPMYRKSEETLARAIEAKRDEAIVATKIWTESAEEGRRQAAHALGLYGTVDIFQVHNLANWRAQLSLLEELKQEGKVKAVGATHYQEACFEDLAKLMSTRRLDMIQIPYNPIRRDAETVLLPLAEELNLGVLVMSPLQGGILDRRPSPDQLAQLKVETWPQAILRWIASDPRISCVLTATSRPGRAGENAKGGEPPLFDPDQRELVRRICAAG
jgi:aryl-alcohol dehydrogenase-like predicted oxidoreductase